MLVINLCSLCLETANGASNSATALVPVEWISFPDPRFELRGLPWFKENAPELWRFPKQVQDKVPKAVWARALAPDGGRIRFKSNTRRVLLRIQAAAGDRGGTIDLYADGQYVGSQSGKGTNLCEVVLFESSTKTLRELTIYLPNRQQMRVLAIAVEESCEMQRASPFRLEKPIVCYGSSVLQGTGAKHPSKTYPAALARQLNLDFVNLGFGGAGKAEPEVVRLVKEPDACAYIFDLGKSYGAQPMGPYGTMLDTIRAAHPKVPIICITPIYSSKEPKDPAYHKKSEDLRALMREAALIRQKAGDKLLFVAEGLEMFGVADEDAFTDPLHPNDEGNERMAKRLAPLVEKVLFGKEAAASR